MLLMGCLPALIMSLASSAIVSHFHPLKIHTLFCFLKNRGFSSTDPLNHRLILTTPLHHRCYTLPPTIAAVRTATKITRPPKIDDASKGLTTIDHCHHHSSMVGYTYRHQVLLSPLGLIRISLSMLPAGLPTLDSRRQAFLAHFLHGLTYLLHKPILLQLPLHHPNTQMLQ